MATETFGSRLREAMAVLGISRGKLAKACGVTRKTVADWQHMIAADLNAQHLLSITERLNCRIRWLALGEGSMQIIIPRSISKDEVSTIADQLPVQKLALWVRLGQFLVENGHL